MIPDSNELINTNIYSFRYSKHDLGYCNKLDYYPDLSSSYLADYPISYQNNGFPIFLYEQFFYQGLINFLSDINNLLSVFNQNLHHIDTLSSIFPFFFSSNILSFPLKTLNLAQPEKTVPNVNSSSPSPCMKAGFFMIPQKSHSIFSASPLFGIHQPNNNRLCDRRLK